MIPTLGVGLHLARYARRVTLVVRARSLTAGMSHYLVRQVEETPMLDVRLATDIVAGGGATGGSSTSSSVIAPVEPRRRSPPTGSF